MRRAGPAGDAFADADWGRYLFAVRRFRWLVLGVALLGSIAALVMIRTRPQRYVARSTIWVETAPRPGSDLGPIRTGQLLGPTGWVDLLTSRAVLDDVVRHERLYLGSRSSSPEARAALESFGVADQWQAGSYRLEVDPDGLGFTLRSEDGTELERGRTGDAVGAHLGFAWAPPRATLAPGTVVELRLKSLHGASRDLARALRWETEPGANFIHLELRGANPDKIARTATAVATRFVAVATELKRQKLSELAGILRQQLDHAQVSLRQAEAALRSFREQNPPQIGQGDAAPGLERFAELHAQRDQLARDRETIGRILTEAQGTRLSIDALGLVASVQRAAELNQALRDLATKQAELRALRHRYTDDHVPVRGLAREIESLERGTIPLLARALMDELAMRERDVSQSLTTVTGDLQRLPQHALTRARLERDVRAAEELTTRIQQRYGEVQLAEVSSLADVGLLDAAEPPERPVPSRAWMLALFAMVASMGVGIVGAVALDRVDRTVRDVGQVTQGFGLGILGALPHIQDQGEGSIQAVDALRGIRLNLMHTYGAVGPILLTVSSPSTRDGKSFVTMNLALAFADAGFNTLLVDGDIRRGRLHCVFRVRRKPGLTDVLAGGVSSELAIQATSRNRLSFLGCGSRTRSGPELLESSAMSRLLGQLRERFGVVLIDSPPLAAGIEPYVLGTLTGNLLLVLRLGMTDRQLAEGKLHALEQLPVRVLGAVLNDVRSPDVYRRYAYSLEGYELHDEDMRWAEQRILRSQS